MYQLLRMRGELTRQDIVRQFGISLPTVVNNINDLRQKGLIKEEGVIRNTGGRRAKTYAFDKNARVAIGLNVTRDYVIAAAVNLSGEISCRKKVWIKYERTYAYYRALGDVVKIMVADAGFDKNRIAGVGIGVPGLVTEDNQTVFTEKSSSSPTQPVRNFQSIFPTRRRFSTIPAPRGLVNSGSVKSPGARFTST